MVQTRWKAHNAFLLKAVVLLSTLYTHEKAEHNRKQFLEILFLLVSFRLLISDLRCKSVTILILCFFLKSGGVGGGVGVYQGRSNKFLCSVSKQM